MIMTRTTALFRIILSLSAGFPADASSTGHTADPLLLRAARGETVERTPVWMMRQAGRHMKAYRDLTSRYPTFRQRSETSEISKEISLQPFFAYGVDAVIMFSDILTPLPAMGIEFEISEGGKIIIEPIRSSEEFTARMKRIDVDTACPFVGKVLGDLREEVGNRATIIGFIGLPFTLGSYVVEGQTGLANGFAQVRRLSRENPMLFHSILSLISDNITDYACYQIMSGAQVIQCFDSWAGHIDADDYSQFALPYQKKVISTIKKRHPDTPIIIYVAPGKFSTDGKRLAELAMTGADIISIDHTVDFATARNIVPDHVGIQGNLDPKVLRDGPLEKIRERTERILAQADRDACGRPHIMNLGHGIEPDTPEANAAYFIKTVQEYQRPINAGK